VSAWSCSSTAPGTELLMCSGTQTARQFICLLSQFNMGASTSHLHSRYETTCNQYTRQVLLLLLLLVSLLLSSLSSWSSIPTTNWVDGWLMCIGYVKWLIITMYKCKYITYTHKLCMKCDELVLCKIQASSL
jgi:TctA family transporter